MIIFSGAVLRVKAHPDVLVTVRLVSGRAVYTDRGVFDFKDLEERTASRAPPVAAPRSGFRTGATSQIRAPEPIASRGRR